jgi:hypothetical protein
MKSIAAAASGASSADPKKQVACASTWTALAAVGGWKQQAKHTRPFHRRFRPPPPVPSPSSIRQKLAKTRRDKMERQSYFRDDGKRYHTHSLDRLDEKSLRLPETPEALKKQRQLHFKFPSPVDVATALRSVTSASVPVLTVTEASVTYPGAAAATLHDLTFQVLCCLVWAGLVVVCVRAPGLRPVLRLPEPGSAVSLRLFSPCRACCR